MPCRSKSLTIVPRLALTPRTSPLKHSAQYAPPLKRIIMTVTMPRPYKTIVLSRFSSAIAHHALKSPDSLSKRNSKSSRKIVTAPCRAKKLEKCHVKHFSLIITQALRPYLPADTDHAKKIGNSADRASFHTPQSSAPFTPPQAVYCASRRCRQSLVPQQQPWDAATKNRLDLAEIRVIRAKRPKQPAWRIQYKKKRDYKQHARHITRSQTK